MGILSDIFGIGKTDDNDATYKDCPKCGGSGQMPDVRVYGQSDRIYSGSNLGDCDWCRGTGKIRE